MPLATRARSRLAAASLVTLVIAMALRTSRRVDPGVRRDIAPLVTAVGRTRPIEARLTGGFHWGPLDRARELAPRPIPPEILAAAATIRRRFEEKASPQDRGDLAVALLLTGDPSAAVAELERALRDSREDARLLTDLSAAYLERSIQEEAPEDLARALECAERAFHLSPSPENAFNRALALERLLASGPPRSAWGDFLWLEGDGEFAAEGRARQSAPGLPAREAAWRKARERLDSALSAGDARAVHEIVGTYRQEVRQVLQDERLSSWAQEFRTGVGRDASAERLMLAREYSSSSGDPLLLECVERIDAGSSLDDLLLGHRRFAEATTRYDVDDFENASALFEVARDALKRARSPLWLWAGLQRAICDYYGGRPDVALEAVRELRPLARRAGYRVLLGKLEWLDALVNLVRDEPVASMRHGHEALASFEGTGEDGYRAAVESLQATALEKLGDRSSAWSARQQARELEARAGLARTRHTGYLRSALMALDDGLPWTALHLQRAAARLEAGWTTAQTRCDSALLRARILKRLGRLDEARRQVGLSRLWASRVPDGRFRQRAQAEVDYGEGAIDDGSSRPEARESLSRAIDYYESTGLPVLLAEAYLTRGRVLEGMGHVGEARSDFAAGIREFERRRLSQGEHRIPYFARASDLFREAIRLSLDAGDSEGALELVERSRARALQDRIGTLPALALRATARRIPDKVSVVVYQTLRDRLAIWVLGSGAVRHVVRPLREDGLERLVSGFRDSLAAANGDASALRNASELYDELIRPVESALHGGDTLVICPDGALHGLPFAALFDSRSRRYLVETRTVVTAPSITTFVLACDRLSRLPTDHPSALVVGDPRHDRRVFPRLPALPDARLEAEEISRLYTPSVLLTGSSATPGRFLEEAPGRQVIHFAGHALPHASNPDLSQLVLSDDGEGGSVAGWRLEGLDLPRTQLAVLSACRSAEGPVASGEGVLSLARTFLATGVPQVVASLWSVSDRRSRALLVAFHRRVSAGSSAAEGLRAAQLELLRGADAGLRSAYGWAAFEAIGGVPEIPARRKE